MHRGANSSARSLAIGLLALGCSASAWPGTVPEQLVTSALVYNIAKLTEWPDNALGTPEAPVTLCLLRERSSYEGIFASVEGKPVKGRPLQIRQEVKLSQLEACQLLYLDEFDEPRLLAVLRALQGLPVLTVGGYEGFAEAGGMVGLFLEQEQMQFRVNREAVADARLGLSSQLLRMARIVDGRTP